MIKKLISMTALCCMLSGCNVMHSQEIIQEHQQAQQNLQLRVAQAAERSGNMSTAANIYKRAYQDNPNDKQSLIHLANLLYSGEQYMDAIRYYHSALAAVPNDPEALSGLAKSYLHLKQPTKSLQLFSSILEQNPRDAGAIESVAVLLDYSNAHRIAQLCHLKALSYSHNDPEYLNNLGLSYALSKDLNKSITLLKRANLTIEKDEKITNNLTLLENFKKRIDSIGHTLESNIDQQDEGLVDPAYEISKATRPDYVRLQPHNKKEQDHFIQEHGVEAEKELLYQELKQAVGKQIALNHKDKLLVKKIAIQYCV